MSIIFPSSRVGCHSPSTGEQGKINNIALELDLGAGGGDLLPFRLFSIWAGIGTRGALMDRLDRWSNWAGVYNRLATGWIDSLGQPNSINPSFGHRSARATVIILYRPPLVPYSTSSTSVLITHFYPLHSKHLHLNLPWRKKCLTPKPTTRISRWNISIYKLV